MGALRRVRRERSDAGVLKVLSIVFVRFIVDVSEISDEILKVVSVVAVVMTMESTAFGDPFMFRGSGISSTVPIANAHSFLGVSEERLASSAIVVGGVELSDATLENVSAGASKLASEELSRDGDIIAKESILTDVPIKRGLGVSLIYLVGGGEYM